jgi:hypothetical protein
MYGSSSPSAAAAKLEQRDLDLVPTVRTDKPPDGHALCEEQIVWAANPAFALTPDQPVPLETELLDTFICEFHSLCRSIAWDVIASSERSIRKNV